MFDIGLLLAKEVGRSVHGVTGEMTGVIKYLAPWKLVDEVVLGGHEHLVGWLTGIISSKGGDIKN